MNTNKQFDYKNIIRPLIAVMIIIVTAVICLMIGPHKKQTTSVSSGDTQLSKSMEYNDASMQLAAEEEPAAVEVEEEPAAVEAEEEPAAVEVEEEPAAVEVEEEPAAVEVEEEPAAVEVEEEPAAVEVEEEPAAEEVVEESTTGATAASEGAADVDIDSIVAPMGYDNLTGREYTTNAHFFYPSGEYEYYSWLDAEFAPFEKGVLGYAVDDFDRDGQNEIVLVTVEDTPIIAEPYDPENVERDYDVKKYRHDVRMKVLEYDENRITWKEASEKAIEMSDYGLYPVTGWFYKKYDDHVSIFFNRSGYLFDRGGHSNAVFCEYQYQDGALEETEASHMLQGFAEATEGQMRFFFTSPEEAREAWNNYGFAMDLDSFSSLTGFYVPDFDQSCVKIAEITASSKVSIADMQGETSDQIIPDAVTYNIMNVR